MNETRFNSEGFGAWLYGQGFYQHRDGEYLCTWLDGNREPASIVISWDRDRAKCFVRSSEHSTATVHRGTLNRVHEEIKRRTQLVSDEEIRKEIKLLENRIAQLKESLGQGQRKAIQDAESKRKRAKQLWDEACAIEQAWS